MIRTAILVDGAFYRKRAMYFWGDKDPRERADELYKYCQKHMNDSKSEGVELYRVFYYDCPPIAKRVYHPLLNTTIDFSKTDVYSWTNTFFKELKHQRKFALRLGKLAEEQAEFIIDSRAMKKTVAEGNFRR